MDTSGNDVANPSPAPVARYARPNWDAIEQDLACPLCGYSLRGLVEPRCPECGYSFTWSDLLDPTRRKHPYLFELHPRNSFSSFWKTAFHGLRPIKFWTTLRADQPFAGWRLLLYALLTAVPLLLATAGMIAMGLACLNAWWGYRFLSNASYDAMRYADYTPLAVPIVIVLLWPWLTFGTLSLLRISMRRANIRSLHIVRCVIYSWDIFLWASLITLASGAITLIQIYASPQSSRATYYTTLHFEALIPPSRWLLLLPVFSYRMLVAYRRYMRFRHATWVILLTQCVVVLLILGGILQTHWLQYELGMPV